MKKLLLCITLLALGAVLFTSCSNSSKIAFTKRHYRNGYFVDLGKRIHTVANPSVAGLPVKSGKQIAALVIAKGASCIAANKPIITSEIQPASAQKIIPAGKAQATNPADNYFVPLIPVTVSLNKTTSDDMAGSSGDGGHSRDNVSVPFVVIVLCAIFIPPLGVGLMYGIDSYFWIDLILTLLFFFPGMIFALIVVLM